MWVYLSGQFESKKIVLFEYTRTRSGENPKKFLENFEGYLVSDAYNGYEKLKILSDVFVGAM